MSILLKMWNIYRKESLYTKLHIFIRAALCPLDELTRYFPPAGKIIDIGCGYGILLNLLANDISNKGRRLFGIDHDTRKITIAKACLNPEIDLTHQRLEDFPAESFDTVSVMDVLYTVALDKWKVFLDDCFRILRPGGKLILKEVVDRPRLKYWIILLQEIIAVSMLRITRGERPHIESRDTYCDALKKSNFNIIKIQPFNMWHWINHCVFIAQK